MRETGGVNLRMWSGRVEWRANIARPSQSRNVIRLAVRPLCTKIYKPQCDWKTLTKLDSFFFPISLSVSVKKYYSYYNANYLTNSKNE